MKGVRKREKRRDMKWEAGEDEKRREKYRERERESEREEQQQFRSKGSGGGSRLRIRGCFQRSTQCSLVSRAGRTGENVRAGSQKEDSFLTPSTNSYPRGNHGTYSRQKRKSRQNRDKRRLCQYLPFFFPLPFLRFSHLCEIWTRHSGMRRQPINASGFKTRWKIKG